MQTLPLYVSIIFVASTLLTLALVYRAANRSGLLLLISLAWLVAQGAVAASGFYTVTNGMPPRFAWAIVPPFALIAWLFLSPAGRRIIDGLHLKTLTMIHLVRIPVELGLYALFLHHWVPDLMTFEGWNPDILSGLSALIVLFVAFRPGKLRKALLLGWNLVCLGLLVNIVTIAVLSAPFDLQRLAFEQPNMAVLHFPMVWLPCFIVPVVLFSHLAAIRLLLLRPADAASNGAALAAA